jgi:hypothetical protein
MFIVLLGQHVSILIESSSGPSKNTDPYLAMFKLRCETPNVNILDITMYNITTHAFYTYLYQECKRLGSHSAF